MGFNLKNIQLIIFDCDGVLVDSEIIANRVFAEEMTKCGYAMDMEQAMTQYLGKSLKGILQTLQESFGHAACQLLPPIHAKMSEALAGELQPIEGIIHLLQLLDQQAIPRCVASNNTAEKISHSLQITGLSQKFLQKNIFCASDVKNGKPHPDLFLHAAQKMQVDPSACLVIEDSVTGIQAAHAAEMQVVGFFGGKHTKYDWYRQRILEANPHYVCETHAEIAHHLAFSE